jgi:hypothetical protein
MKRRQIIPWILAAVIVAGCVPTRYSWSPDGKWMTVIYGDDDRNGGLKLCDANGNLTRENIPGVQVASWFPDSKRLIVSRMIDERTWKDLTRWLSKEQLTSIAAAGEHVEDALTVYDWTAPGASDWQKFLASMNAEDDQSSPNARVLKEYGLAVGLYVHDHVDAAIQKKIPLERWNELAQLSQPVHAVEIYPADPFRYTRMDDSIKTPRLMTTLKDVRALRVSPTGAAAIVTTESDQDHASSLWIVSTAGDRPAVCLSNQAAWYPDWSPDGRDVIFIRSAQPAVGDAACLGSVSRVRVIGDDGALIEKPGNPEDLAGLVYDELSRVRCLKDGRILFASAEVTLPATAKDMPQRPQLFSLTPGSTAAVSQLLSKQASEQVGNAAQFFEVSPDSQYVSLPDESGKVSVVDLRTGDVTAVQNQPVTSKDHGGQLLTIPQWRSNDELTIIAPGENDHPSVVLWSISKKSGKTLSAGWPMDSIEYTATGQPATRP